MYRTKETWGLAVWYNGGETSQMITHNTEGFSQIHAMALHIVCKRSIRVRCKFSFMNFEDFQILVLDRGLWVTRP
jgi:hypothetical protein